MDKLDCKRIAGWCGGCITGKGNITGVVTDSRKVTKGCLFVALKGEKFNGHDFIEKAFEQGAAGVISEKSSEVPEGRFMIMVPDTLKAFAQIARGYRDLFRIPVIGVTGSVGKTSTKEYIASVLSQKYHTLKTQGNLNNEIGLPSMVMELAFNHQAAVFEMGMSRFGEIARLSAICRPDIGVITNIGVAHIEMLGSREGILQAKMEIIEGMDPNSLLVLNGDEPLLYTMKGKLPRKTLYYGIDNKDCDFIASNIQDTKNGQKFEISGRDSLRAEIVQKGRHNIYNALCAYVCGNLLGIGKEECQQGLLSYAGQKMRQHILNADGMTIIDDTYNANPDSMKAALSVLGSYPGKKIAVLGDMLELGDYSRECHLGVGRFAAEMAVDYIFAKGPQMKYCLAGAQDAGISEDRLFHFESDREIAEALKKIWESGCVVLFKGSRGMKMENVLDLALKGEKENG